MTYSGSSDLSRTRGAMAFQGNNQATGIADLFTFISQRRLTGMLVIASKENDRSFFFRRGELIYALASDQGRLLGDNLVRELGVDPKAIEQIAAANRSTYLGEELVNRGYIDQESLNGVVERQIRFNIREVLRWSEWAFHFEVLDPSASVPELQISTQLLIFDLTRELDEWESIEQIFPELDTVMSRKSLSISLKVPVEWDDELPPAGEVLQNIDGTRNARQLLQESAIPVRLHARALSILVKHGVIEMGLAERSRRKNIVDDFVLPVIPNLPARILALSSDPNAGPEDYQELITSDPILTARMMRLAMLQKRGDTSKNFSLDELLSKIGLQSLKSFLLADAVRGLFLFPTSFTWHQNWEQAYTNSIACRHIAELINYQHLDLAQVAGLLHDIGCTSLAARNPRAYQKVFDYVRSSGVNLLRAEEQVFQTNHAEVGAQLGEAWGFPQPVVEVIRNHHQPVRAHQEDPLLNIVRLADYLMVPGGSETQLSRTHLRRLTDQLGLSEVDFGKVKERVGKSSYSLQTAGVLTAKEVT